MARRRNSSIKPVWIFAAVALVAVAVIGSLFMPSGGSDRYRTIAPLDVSAYLENSNSLRGNVYKVEGEVANSLAWSPTSGRLIAVEVEEGREVIPVLVTTKFNEINIQRGQRFIFVLEVDEKGILRTRDLSKA